ALAAKVQELAGQLDELARRGRRGRSYAELHYSRPAITNAYQQQLEELHQPAGRAGS
ncbi:MAG: hypothetical protein RIR86_579, partial [Acidobacteriota bacterium]